MPGDEARVYALRAAHEAQCPARNRGTGQAGQSAPQSSSDSYGVVTVYNQTGEPVTYSIQTRSGGRWSRTTVQPGGWYYHWQTSPAKFALRISTGFLSSKTFQLEHNVVTGRQPTAQDGRPFTISGSTKAPSVTSGAGAGKPQLSKSPCLCNGDGCVCIWDSCGAKGARKCGCGGKADCECEGTRCPKFANTTECTGSTLWDADGRQHCNLSRGQKNAQAASFAGTWRGTLKLGISGTFRITLKVSPDGSSVYESGAVLDGSHQAKIANGVLTWRTGVLNEVKWTLEPGRDGASAVVSARSPLGITDTATFERK